jgi:hypothetical protein
LNWDSSVESPAKAGTLKDRVMTAFMFQPTQTKVL